MQSESQVYAQENWPPNEIMKCIKFENKHFVANAPIICLVNILGTKISPHMSLDGLKVGSMHEFYRHLAAAYITCL